MNADAKSKRDVGHVSDPELAAFAEYVECHRTDLARVPITVADRQPTAHHVRVTNRLNLVVVLYTNRYTYTPFTRSSQHRADTEQTSSKR